MLFNSLRDTPALTEVRVSHEAENLDKLAERAKSPEELDVRLVPVLRNGAARKWPRKQRSLGFKILWEVERRFTTWLGHHFLPAVPGIHRAYGAQLRRGLSLATSTVRFETLPEAWRGARILVLSDLHMGAFLSPRDLAEALERLRPLRPDLIVILGDFVVGHVDELKGHEETLKTLEAKHGVFGVLGNHDHYTNQVETLRRKIEALGVRLLHNESVDLEGLTLLGIDDWGHGEPDLIQAAGEGSDQTARPRILLSHNPDAFFDASELGIDLVLSGHTHGGQVRFPGVPPLLTMSQHRLTHGHFEDGDSQLIVTNGLGVVALPVRLFCPPEAILLTLEERPQENEGKSEGDLPPTVEGR